MKKFFIKAVSVIMVVFVVLTSAPLQGFVGMDWSWLDFSVKASAEDYIEIPDDLEDYSYLTSNQYMAKVILNSDYIGTANQYGKIETNEKFKEYMYYLNPYQVSFAKTLCRALENNTQFYNNLYHWELLNFDPTEATEKLLERKDYYIAILYNIIDQKMQDSEFLEALDCTTNETILSLSKGAASTLESLYQLEVERLDKIKTSDLSDPQIHELLNGMAKNYKVQKFYDQLGSNFDDVGVITKGCTTVYDVIKNVSMYSSLIDVAASIKDVLAAVNECVPKNDIVMKAAVQEVYKTCSEQITETTFTMIKAGEKIVDNVVSRLISRAWKAALGPISSGIEFGQAIGRGISNFYFSSDATIEQYYALSCLTKFEDVMIDALIKLSVNFKNNESSDNANAFLMGIRMLLSTYSLGCDYSYTFADIVKNKGFVNFISSFWEDNDTVEQYKSAVNDMKGVLNLSKRFLTCLDGYIAYYKWDAPIAYKAYFETPADENKTSLKYAYSPDTTPFYVETLTDNNGNIAILSYTREADNTITITNCNPSARGNITIPDEFNGIPVSKIAYRAFRDCDKIISVTFNNSLKIIENYAFQDCASLNKVTLNDGLETIGGRAFANTALTSVLIPKTVSTMYASAGDSGASSALENIKTLKSVIFEYGMTKIPKRALEDCSAVISISIPSSVTEIDINAFKHCTGLTELNLPNSLRTIGEAAFSYCTGLSELTLPNNLRTIGEGAFSNCSNLIEIVLNDGLETIGGRAFANTALAEVLIPKTVTTMYTGYLGSYRSAFEDVETLKSVTFENGTNEIPIGALCNCSSVVNVSIPNGVTRIGDRVFYNCEELTNVTIPDSVTSIDGEAFCGCESLTNITIPDYVTTIDSFAFYNCTALTSVTIPKSVEIIYNWAFSNCDSLEDVHYRGTKEQWEQIEIELHNEPLISAKIHFNLNGSDDVHTHNYYLQESKPASCTEPGGSTYVCSCGDTYSVSVPFLGHSFSLSYTVDKEPTCTEFGRKSRHCTRSGCNARTSEEIIFIIRPHTFTEKIIDSAHLESAATTQSPAIYKYDCVNCDTISEDLTFTHGEKLNVTLGKPSKINTVQNTSSIRLTWTPVDGATGYRVFLMVNGAWKTLATGTATTYMATNLTAGTKYTFAVRAYRIEDGKVVWAPQFTTLETATTTIAPAKVASVQNTNAIKLAWTACPGATGYRIFFKVNGAWKTCLNATTATSHTFTRLPAGTTYTFAVRPYIIAGGVVIWSNFTEYTAATLPLAPTVSAVSAAKGKATVSWSEVSGAEAYQVYYRMGNGAYKIFKAYTSPQNLNFTLYSNTNYTFAVRAAKRTSAGWVYGAFTFATVKVK